MHRIAAKSHLFRILAVLLCVTVLVFFSAILAHHHSADANGDAAHCQVCALGHTTASIAAVIDLIVVMHVLRLTLRQTPSRGSPPLVAIPVTRPPPFGL